MQLPLATARILFKVVLSTVVYSTRKSQRTGGAWDPRVVSGFFVLGADVDPSCVDSELDVERRGRTTRTNSGMTEVKHICVGGQFEHPGNANARGKAGVRGNGGERIPGSNQGA